jgi:hypothetical protein
MGSPPRHANELGLQRRTALPQQRWGDRFRRRFSGDGVCHPHDLVLASPFRPSLAAAIDDQTFLGEVLDRLANIFICDDLVEVAFHINCPLLLWM